MESAHFPDFFPLLFVFEFQMKFIRLNFTIFLFDSVHNILNIIQFPINLLIASNKTYQLNKLIINWNLC